MGYTHLSGRGADNRRLPAGPVRADLLADLEAVDHLLRSLRGQGFKGAVGTAASYEHLLRPLGRTAAEMEQRAMAYLA